MTATTDPVDQQDRDRIAHDLDATLFVEAGAGTGKTSALVGRVLELVAVGTELRQIAAITFTEAAAAELRDRVREELEAAIADPATDAARRQRFDVALIQIDGAAIQTLHGFAQRILALYPLEAGLPPRIEIVDPVAARIAFNERWDALLDELLTDERHGLPIVPAIAMGLRPDDLAGIAREFHEHYDQLSRWHFPPPPRELAFDALTEAFDALAQLKCLDDSDLLWPSVAAARAYASDLLIACEELGDEEDDGEEDGDETARYERLKDILDLLRQPPKTDMRGGRRDSWNADVKTVRDCVRAILDARKALLADYRASLLAPLLERLRRWALDYAAARRAAGTLEFHDLLVIARDLVRDDAGVRVALRDRYRRLLVDELQDTDPIQLEIAALLATPEGDVTDRDWSELPVDRGRLFFVGDPKQAIYHFRGADIALYGAAREVFGAEPVTLRQNFRTVPAIIGWVNRVFEQVIAAGWGDAQPAYTPLSAFREPPPGPAVRMLGGPKDADGVDGLRQNEAAEIVRAIRAVKAEGWPVIDRATGERRPARYEDICVLLPARTTLQWLESALETAHVPYRVESRSLLYETQEVRDLTNILGTIDDPTDEVALVAALRSPAFACADDDLYEWARARGRWDYRREAPLEIALDHPVAEAMTALRVLHDERWSLPLNELIERVIRERKMFELGYAFHRPRERWQRLRFVVDQGRAFAAEGARTLREFVAWLRQQEAEDVAIVDTVVAHADDDAVRITTIHAAKGLEFPVVVMSGLNTGRPQRYAKAFWTSGNRPEVRIGRKDEYFETPGYAATQALERQLDLFEKLRLLYVAATRARDHLVVSVHHKANGRASDDTHAQLLHRICAGFPELWTRYVPPEQAGPADDGAAAPADEPLVEVRWEAERAALFVAQGAPAALAATAIAHAAESAEPETDAAPWRRGRAGTSIGRAVHATLQSADLGTGRDIDAIARAQAAAEGIPGAAGRVVTLARAALAAPSVREALSSRHWREVYVGAGIEGTIVEGFIDLLYETPEGLVVVDYKTDSVASDAAVDAAMGRYRLQGATYVLALRELAAQIGRPAVKCVFVFVSGDEPRERAVEGNDLAAAIAEVRARVAGAAPYWRTP